MMMEEKTPKMIYDWNVLHECCGDCGGSASGGGYTTEGDGTQRDVKVEFEWKSK